MSARHDARRTATQFLIDAYLRKDASRKTRHAASCVIVFESVETGCSPAPPVICSTESMEAPAIIRRDTEDLGNDAPKKFEEEASIAEL